MTSAVKIKRQTGNTANGPFDRRRLHHPLLVVVVAGEVHELVDIDLAVLGGFAGQDLEHVPQLLLAHLLPQEAERRLQLLHRDLANVN